MHSVIPASQNSVRTRTTFILQIRKQQDRRFKARVQVGELSFKFKSKASALNRFSQLHVPRCGVLFNLI